MKTSELAASPPQQILSAKLAVCVDGRMLHGPGTGVSTYARSLTRAVAGMGGDTYLLTATNEFDRRLVKWAGALLQGPRRLRRDAGQGVEVLTGRDVFRRAHVHFNLYRRLLPVACDLKRGIMHWTYPVPLFMEGWINLYTVHDVIPFTRPDLTPINASRHLAVLRAISARAHRLVTVSDASRHDIVSALGCDPAGVINCGEAIDIGGARTPCGQYGLTPKGYLLHCGSIEPRKNLTALLDAYRASAVDMPLVLVGPNGWRAEPILKQIEQTPGAIRLPFLDRADLLGLIEGARGLVMPSLAEGFGLPVVEAMALGAPVMTSHCGALAEVAGDAALLVDPEDVGAMAGGLGRLAADDTAVRRLAALGFERARIFSPEAFASRLAEVYGSAIADSHPAADRQAMA